MAIIAAIARPRWPTRSGVAHSVAAGILVHGFYLGGTAVAIAHSIPAGLSALIPGLQPILTSTLANRWLGERVTPLQWIGLLLGLAGVVLILHDRPMSGEAGWGWLASGVSLVSITLGTLYQRRYCGDIDWRAGNLVQYIAVTIFFAAGAWLFESNVVHWTSEFVLSVIWLAVVLSIGSIGLLYWLIRRSAATSVASLFYLVPAVTAADGLYPVRRDGSTGSRSPAWLPAPRRCSWSTGARTCARGARQQLKPAPGFDRRLRSRRWNASALRLLGLLFLASSSSSRPSSPSSCRLSWPIFSRLSSPAFLLAFLAFFAFLLSSSPAVDFLGDFLGRLLSDLLGDRLGLPWSASGQVIASPSSRSRTGLSSSISSPSV